MGGVAAHGVDLGSADAALEVDGVSSATSSLMLPEVAEVLNPAKGEGIDPKTFLQDKGTLFLVGTKTGGGAAAPMLMALMDEITATAREMAIRLPGNRLDPPLTLILDEIANLAPWKELPTVMSDGGGVGISTVVILQSPPRRGRRGVTTRRSRFWTRRSSRFSWEARATI